MFDLEADEEEKYTHFAKKENFRIDRRLAQTREMEEHLFRVRHFYAMYKKLCSRHISIIVFDLYAIIISF